MYFFTSLKTKIWINSARDVSINNSSPVPANFPYKNIKIKSLLYALFQAEALCKEFAGHMSDILRLGNTAFSKKCSDGEAFGKAVSNLIGQKLNRVSPAPETNE